MGNIEQFRLEENTKNYELIQMFDKIALMIERNDENQKLMGIYQGQEWAPTGYQKISKDFWVSFQDPKP